MEIFLTALFIILGCTAFYLFHQRRDPQNPPCISGWIPWIGAGFKFGEAPLEFIEQARIKHGPVFTIFALGNRITFVTEEEGIDFFFKSKDINFEHAVQHHVKRTVSVTKDIFFTFHGILYGLMKNKMRISHLYQFTEKMVEELHEQLETLGTDGKNDLFNLVRNNLYPVTVNIVFGKGLYPITHKKILEFHEHFQNFDEGFQFGSQIPECFLRNWSKSKKWFLTLFEKSIPDLERYRPSDDDSLTILQLITGALRQGTSEHQAPNYALLMLWASLSNAIPVAFWTIMFILHNPSVYKNIMEGIVSVFGEAVEKEFAAASRVLLPNTPRDSMSHPTPSVTVQLLPPALGVMAIQQLPYLLLNYTIPAGDMLMLSPFWIHRNPKYFPEPELFKPERWEKADLEKNAFLDCFLAFGGGKYPCPGRWFALLELEIYVALLFYKYQLSLLDPFPKQNFNQLVGVQKPVTPCRVEYKCRK
ncbi:24-hydroxycholesterol 7-alpha-hydroxylase [Gracilinanus agilis]|uniref:24-hydroxycholesterol 7-alpha-hydroxylase n=1 Tax=Gracilinanus agilis TaxID=191870 RepID=UPI001CFC69BD|nr:24-hydroxycholesterol 7-alpha-hydroxylase [Gracilinanus agilis]